MDKRICVYEAGETDFASNGMGIISPVKCLVHWEENGEYSAEIEHPIDALGKYERLNAYARTVVIPVPEAPSMRLNRVGSTTSVEVYTIATRKSRLRLRSGPGTGYKCLGYYAKGKKVTLINKTNNSWYEVTAPDGKHGWMSANYLSFSHNKTVGTISTEILRDLPMRPQPFDIYAIDPGLDAISVKARHVFYRLAENLVCSLEIKEKTAQEAIDAVFAAAENQEHGFNNWYCEDTETMSLENPIEGKNLVDIILGDGGICETYGLKLLVDWFDIFLVKEIGQDRGVRLRYGKNIAGLEGGIDISNVVTRLIPVGQTKNGKPLYLDGTKYIESSNAFAYPRAIYGHLPVSEAKVGGKVDGKTLTTASARTMMRKAAQAELDAGCDLPNCSITATMVQLRYDPAYGDFAALERVCPGDTLGLFVPNFGLTLTIRLSAYSFDALSQAYDEMTLGSPQANVSNTGVSSRQLGGSSVTSSKIAPNAVGPSALADDVVSARHMQAESVNTEALQAFCVTANKVAAGEITAEKLDAESVSAKVAEFVRLKCEEIVTNGLTADKLYAALANIVALAVECISAETIATNRLYAALADVIVLRAQQIDADSLRTDALAAEFGKITALLVGDITAGNVQTNQLAAALGEFVTLYASTAKFDFATVQNMVAGAMVLQQGVGGSVTIENLVATSAMVVQATMGKLVLKGSDGKYYEVTVRADGVIAAEEVVVTSGEITAGQTAEGKGIVETNAVIQNLNSTNIKAQSAIISEFFTAALTADKITAAEAMLASATIPELYVTAVKALGGGIDISANEYIRTIVSNLSSLTTRVATAEQKITPEAITNTVRSSEYYLGDIDAASIYDSEDPPAETPIAGKKWLDRGVTPPVIRRWRGAEAPVGREYEQTAEGNPLVLDNTPGQAVRIAVEMGCVAEQAGSGNPGPDNVRAIRGRKSVTAKVCGRNLLALTPGASVTSNGLTATVAADGGIKVAGTPTATAFLAFAIGSLPSGVYTISNATDSPIAVAHDAWARITNLAQSTQLTAISLMATTSGASFTLAAAQGALLVLRIGAGNAIDTTLYLQLASGAEATAYQPYTSIADITISPAAPLYGLPGAEDVVRINADGSREIVRRTGRRVLDGAETGLSVSTHANGQPYLIVGGMSNLDNTSAKHMCTHYKHSYSTSDGYIYIPYSAGMVINDARFTSLQAARDILAAQYAAGTPVTVVYELAEPVIEQLDPIDPVEPHEDVMTVMTDADALNVTHSGSGWEAVNDTGEIAEAANAALDFAREAGAGADAANAEIARVAKQIITPAEVVATVEASDGYRSMKTQMSQTAGALDIVRQETIPGLDGRVRTLEGGVHIEGGQIGIWQEGSPYRNTITSGGWEITEDGNPVMTCAGTKLIAPRVQVGDALMLGGVAFKVSGDRHLRLLKYGR